MRVILILLAVIAGSAAAGFAVRKRDPIAAVLLFVFATATAVVLTGAFFGWLGA